MNTTDKDFSDLITVVLENETDEDNYEMKINLKKIETNKNEDKILEKNIEIQNSINPDNKILVNKGHELIHYDRLWTLVSSSEALFQQIDEFLTDFPRDNLVKIQKEVEQIYLNSIGTTN